MNRVSRGYLTISYTQVDENTGETMLGVVSSPSTTAWEHMRTKQKPAGNLNGLIIHTCCYSSSTVRPQTTFLTKPEKTGYHNQWHPEPKGW